MSAASRPGRPGRWRSSPRHRGRAGRRDRGEQRREREAVREQATGRLAVVSSTARTPATRGSSRTRSRIAAGSITGGSAPQVLEQAGWTARPDAARRATSARTSPRRTYRRPPSLMLCSRPARAQPPIVDGREVDVRGGEDRLRLGQGDPVRRRRASVSRVLAEPARPPVALRASPVPSTTRPAVAAGVEARSRCGRSSPRLRPCRSRIRRRPPPRRCAGLDGRPALLLRPAGALVVDRGRGDRLAHGPSPHSGHEVRASAWTPWITSKRRPHAAQS